MTEPDPKLTLAEPDDLADSLSFALRFEGRKSQHDSDRLNADIEAGVPKDSQVTTGDGQNVSFQALRDGVTQKHQLYVVYGCFTYLAGGKHQFTTFC
jgi:hypothetical protein